MMKPNKVALPKGILSVHSIFSMSLRPSVCPSVGYQLANRIIAQKLVGMFLYFPKKGALYGFDISLMNVIKASFPYT